jgi:hypothetical protein
MRNDYKIRPRPEFKGGGIATRGTGVALRGGGIATRGTGVALKDGSFPDLTGDGKVTFKDILKGRGAIKKKGGMIKKSMHKMPNGKMMKNSNMRKK